MVIVRSCRRRRAVAGRLHFLPVTAAEVAMHKTLCLRRDEHHERQRRQSGTADSTLSGANACSEFTQIALPTATAGLQARCLIRRAMPNLSMFEGTVPDPNHPQRSLPADRHDSRHDETLPPKPEVIFAQTPSSKAMVAKLSWISDRVIFGRGRKAHPEMRGRR